MMQVYSWWEFSSKRPLVVFAAGNKYGDAFFSGVAASILDSLTGVLDSDRSARTLIVTASQPDSSTSSSLPAFANRGHLVTVAAPGKDVWMLDSVGTFEMDSGTSFAAAHVSGLAAMLRAFDPDLTADSLKSLIVQGALLGGRVVTNGTHPNGSIPIINAWESLKRAAQKPGRPLCGNFMFSQTINGDSSTLFAWRDTGVVEPILTLETSKVTWSAAHGGRKVGTCFSLENPCVTDAAFSAGTGWSASTQELSWQDMTGTERGAGGQEGKSHDGLTVDVGNGPGFLPDTARLHRDDGPKIRQRLDENSETTAYLECVGTELPPQLSPSAAATGCTGRTQGISSTLPWMVLM